MANYYMHTCTVRIIVVSVCHSLTTIDTNCEHNLEHFRWNSSVLQHSIMGRRKSIIGWCLTMWDHRICNWLIISIHRLKYTFCIWSTSVHYREVPLLVLLNNIMMVIYIINIIIMHIHTYIIHVQLHAYIYIIS